MSGGFLKALCSKHSQGLTQKNLPTVLKTIKEDNLGDMNKLYLRLQSLFPQDPENCKMGWEAGSFSRMKNQEQGREK